VSPAIIDGTKSLIFSRACGSALISSHFEMAEQSDKQGSIGSQSAAGDDTSAVHDCATSAKTPPQLDPAPLEPKQARQKRKLLVGLLGVAALAVLMVFGIPWVEEMLNTVHLQMTHS
jgi:hypothetical protein